MPTIWRAITSPDIWDPIREARSRRSVSGPLIWERNLLSRERVTNSRSIPSWPTRTRRTTAFRAGAAGEVQTLSAARTSCRPQSSGDSETTNTSSCSGRMAAFSTAWNRPSFDPK